ncbi:MAG TPA: hypothetical protein VMZ50_08445 [Phycisphaerae bacterium]|nr:hypothetical protein [Phycisphaerae bacterium]
MTNEAGAVLVVDVEELDGEFLLEVMRGQETPRVWAIRHAPVVELRGLGARGFDREKNDIFTAALRAAAGDADAVRISLAERPGEEWWGTTELRGLRPAHIADMAGMQERHRRLADAVGGADVARFEKLA